MRIVLQLTVVTKDGANPVLILQEGSHQSMADLVRDLVDGQKPAGTSWALDLEVVTVIVMELLQRFHEQEIDREPDRPAPVRVAAEQTRVRFGGLVLNRHALAIPMEG